MKPSDASFSIAKPRRRWLNRLGCGLLILLILLTPPTCAWILWDRSLRERLDEALVEVDRRDPGWRLEDIEAAREQIAEEENSARVVLAAGKLLPKRWPPRDLDDLLVHLSPQEELAPKDFARLEEELEKGFVRAALDEARKLQNMPHGRHRIIYQRNILNTLLNDIQETRRIAKLLELDALRYNQKGDGKNALASCRAVINAGRSIGDEPDTISQLTRGACVIAACKAAERTLLQSEPLPDGMTSLQQLLEMEDAHQDLLILMRGERATRHALFDAVESGDVSLNGILPDVRWNWFEYVLISIWRMNTLEDHVLMLSLMTRAVANARLPMHEQHEGERQLDQEVRQARSLPRPPILTGLLMPHMSEQGEYSRRTHAYLRCTIAGLAAERYRQTHKKWPASLDEFCPQFLAAVPLDPFDGESLRYRHAEDAVIIYSVSSDEIDDGGNLDREHPNQPGVDIGVRLWDVAKRRQPPRPKEQKEDDPR